MKSIVYYFKKRMVKGNYDCFKQFDFEFAYYSAKEVMK